MSLDSVILDAPVRLTDSSTSARAMLQVEHFCLAYDLDSLKSILSLIIREFPPHFRHCCAVKANPLKNILQIAVDLGFGLEVASHPELIQASSLLKDDSNLILFDSPAKTQEELLEALRIGATINIDNLGEFDRLQSLTTKFLNACTAFPMPLFTPLFTPCLLGCGIRINPQIGPGSIHITSTATSTSKFGIGLLENRPRILELYSKHGWLQGLHQHIGSQGCTIDLLIQGAKAIVELALEINALRKERGMDELKYIDIGGGLTVDYGFDPDTTSPRSTTELPKFSEYARRLREAVPYLFENKNLIVFTEFGRSVSAQAGSVISEVEYVKETGGRKMAVIHCGADMFVRPAYLPQIWKHRITVLNKEGKAKSAAEDQLYEWDIVGPLCFSGDIVAHQRKLPDIVSGDYIIIHDAGAYTLGMWSRYNSRQSPSVIGYSRLMDGSWEGKVLRHRETVQQVLQFWQ